ncbi:breast cancer type 2 susceptibility protein [Etheostoma cragini]|uniref:breast cancer type 2 susceptibility protein n=1 Tax=Etheostoma cragini TaxID=417921 RepID=UPI00155EC363|nr:breast cancer type 2 susceptibility protein [Etheostoma cragini]
MDLPSKNMYDTYKDEIWQELGPLDPDWFEALTAQTFTNEGNASDQDDLCANQEGHFKTPFDRTVVESQLFSTPKVFRQRRVVSPETEDEQSFAVEQEKETLPWTATQSPYLFRMSKEGSRGAKYEGFPPQSQDSFDLLHTPQKTPVSYGKRVSESLGAQIHCDMSWTSSLNTPPPSTLILSKTDESPCPVSLSDEKNVVLVRKLFPSLSNASRVGVVSPNKKDIPNFHQGGVFSEPGQNPDSHHSPQSSLNHLDTVWKQTLPDAIEDGDTRRTIASVLDGAENDLSIFFTNCSSALRKVKTERIKRKQILPTKEHDCSSADTSPTSSAASSEQRTADQAPCRLPSPPPVKTGTVGITQWSPLSLSEISHCTVDTSFHHNTPVKQVENNILREQLQSDAGQLVMPPKKLTDSGFTKKKRTFVYSVVKTSKTQVPEKETPSRKMDSSPGIPDFSGQEVNVKQLRKSPDEADGCSNGKNEMQKQGNLAEENLPPSVQAKVPDLDMSQLCKDFAQDFSQMSDPVKLSRIAEDPPQNDFSPSACLSALKQAKKKVMQVHYDCDAVSNRRQVSTTNQNNPIDEGGIIDSGFQSAVVDNTHVATSSFLLPSSKINSQSQQWTGFKTDIDRTSPFTSTHKGNGEAHLDDILPVAEMHGKLSSAIKERQTLRPGSETQLPSNAKGTVDKRNCIPLNGQVHGSLLEKTVYLPSVHASGFKTASNKGIHIYSANLERAKRLLEETKEEMTLSDQPTQCAHDTKVEMSMSDGSAKNPTINSNQPLSLSEKDADVSCQLTASQKADVTELCTLLEEADSQFELTQFKTAKLKPHCQDNATPPKEVDKELDPDFLSGIDFDDSFSSEAEKHLAVTVIHEKMALVSDGKPNSDTSNITSKSTGLPLSSAMKTENSSPEDVSFSSKHISEDSGGILSAEPISLDRHGQTKTSQLQIKNPLMLGGVGFKTAGGNVLKVSKKCLSKARALFADLEENLVTSQNPPDKQTNSKTLHKRSVNYHTGDLLHLQKDNSKFTDDPGERVQSCFSNAMESVCPDRKPRGDEDALKTLNSSIMHTTTHQRGFQMANGKGISTSAKAMQEVDAFFKDCEVIDGNAGMSVKPKKSIPLPESVSLKETLPKGINGQGIKENLAEEPINECENVNGGPAARHTEVVQHNMDSHNFGVKSTLALTNAASFSENTSSTAKAHSSLSCATSKRIGPSAISEVSDGGGFCLASGAKVSTSADAMKKAEHLLNEIHPLKDANQQPKQKGEAIRTGHLNNQIQVRPSKIGSFHAARGKRVAISSAALRKAKLLSECDKVEDKICLKPTHSKMAVPGPISRNSGFLAASGKPVAFSSEALQKAKALFSDISLSAEIPAVPDTRNSDTKQDDADNTEKKHCGFTTAGGAKVHVSQKSLLKAKNLLEEFDDGSISTKAMQEADAFFKDCDMDDNDAMSVKHEKGISSVSGSGIGKKNLSKFKKNHKVSMKISEEPGGGRTEFENVSVGLVVNHEKMMHPDDMEIHKDVVKNTLDSTKAPSLHGNPTLMTGQLSLKSCTTSIDSSANIELSKGAGFSTASGKKVSVSDDALTKAKSLLNESATFEDTNKQLKHKEDIFPTHNGGFQMASGKGVTISSAAEKKAKTLLNECDKVEDKIYLKPTHSKMAVPGPQSRNSGFLAASGKPVAFSSEALQKAKALFSDISLSAEIPAVPDTRNSDKKQDNADNTEKKHCGFTTAGGAKVHVSQKSLLKAKNLLEEFDDGSISTKAVQEAEAFFKDCDIMDDNNAMSVKHEKSIASVSGSGIGKKNLSKFKKDHKVSIKMPEEPGGGRTEFENVSVGLVVNHEKMMHPDDMEIHKDDVKNTLDSTKAPSLHGNPTLMTGQLSLKSCTTSIDSSANIELSKGAGFCTASGKKVSVSDDALTKAKSLLNESATFEDTNKQLKHKEDIFPTHNGAFQMASSKGVTISSAAVKKAKKLLNECDKVEDTICLKPTNSKMAVPGPISRNSGFLAASGKPVAFSSEALQKAKALFSDISLSAEIPAVPDTRNSDKKQDNADNTEKKHCGFTTAGGAKVHVSQKSLLKAKNLMTELADGECHSNSHSTSPHDTHKSDLSKAKDVKRTLNCYLSPEEEMSSVLDGEIDQTSSSEGSNVKRQQESSVVNFQSLNLSGCTETQQRFFAQEALDCTKALLEDESVAGQSLSMTLENVPLQENPGFSHRSAEEQKGPRKRSVEDPDMTGQPPLKRRLLEEFDRTVDGPRGSTLHPDKSFPNDIMKDRRVFKYSVSLHPNITRPDRNGKNYVETTLQKTKSTQQSTPEDSRSAHSKLPVFVPPFLKDAKTERHKNPVLKNAKTPTSFVPPFKKQLTVVQESSSKPQGVTPINSNTYVPPTKKTQSNTDVTVNNSKEDIQTVVSADTTNDNPLINQTVTVSCGSVDSAAEVSRVEDPVSTSQDMFQDLHNIELARDMQDMRIRKKKRQTIRPLPGSLFLIKTSGVSRIPLKAAVNGKPPRRYTQKQLYGRGVHQHVYEITSEIAESFRFNLRQFLKQEAFIDSGGVQLADGGLLIPSNDGTAGKEEFHRALSDTPGVDPKLISEGWVYNHYRWIVWKQASMERSFPETMGSLCLTPEQILLQLKYRYDVEVDNSRRPALRKIMEKDDTSAKTLVLCVCGVVSRGQTLNRQSFNDTKTPQGADAKVENPSAVVWLTDGWYAIKAQLDEPLTAMLNKGRVAVGGKLIIHGAQLVGSQDACSPLEAPESLMLKICANSSRPTRWDAKLGFHRDPRPFLLPVSCLYSNGGPVGCVDIIILRSYPIQWMERKPDGGVVFRSDRAEEKEARRYDGNKQKALEILYAKIQAEFEKEDKGNKPQHRRRTFTRQEISRLQDGDELYEAVGNDPAYLEAHLSEEQLETLRTFRCSLMEKKQAVLQDRYRRALESAEDSEGICPKREVTPVWRLCVADSMDQPGSVYQLNLWRPSSDLQSLAKEGCRYKVYNLTTSDGKKHGCSTTVQLTGTKKSQFQDLQASQEMLATRFQPRVSTCFVDLQNPEFQPLCGEIDLTGYVISIVDGQGFSPAFYLTDGKLNFVKVRCFSSLAQAGLEDLVKPHVLLALSNLQLRGQSTSPTPVVYAGDLTLFSTNPKEAHLQESLSQLKNLIQGQENFLQIAEKKFSHLVQSDGLKSISSPALQTRTPASASVRRQDTRTSVTPQQPVRSLGAFTPVSRKPPAANCLSEKDPVSLKRKRALDYLSRIPSPPSLSHLGSVASPFINKTFNPPRRSGTPCTLKTVQTPACKPINPPVEDDWVNDEELAMIDTQALRGGNLV